jgi:glucose dehydrogenase
LAPLVLITVMLAPLMGAPPERKSKAPPIQPADWRTCNHSFKGWRYNPAENHLAPDKVANLQLKWQFPSKGSKEVVEAINSTYEPGDRGRLAYRQHQTTQGLVPRDGIYSSALVTRDSVYFADVAGVAYCLDRLTGNEKWALNTQFSERPSEAYFPKSTVGTLYSFGLPGEDEISKLGAGHE